MIVADGIRSNIAAALLGSERRYAGYHGLLATCRCLDDGWPPGRAQEFWRGTERFGVFDLSDGWRYWFAMNSAGEMEADSTLAVIRARVNAPESPWNDAIRLLVNATSKADTYPVAIYAAPPPKQMGRGRTICIGDAAHPMEPNQGQGGCQSIEDGWALGSLAKQLPIEAILPSFEKLRLQRVAGYVRNSALIGTAAHSNSRTARFISRSIIGAIPDWVTRRQLAAGFKPPDYG